MYRINKNMKTLEGKAGLIESFQPYLAKLPDSILKDSIINELANNFGTGSQQLLNKLNKQQLIELVHKYPFSSQITKKTTKKHNKIKSIFFFILVLYYLVSNPISLQKSL